MNAKFFHGYYFPESINSYKLLCILCLLFFRKVRCKSEATTAVHYNNRKLVIRIVIFLWTIITINYLDTEER